MESADRMLRRHVAVAPAWFVLRAGDANQREAHAVRIGEGQHGFAEALLQRLMGNAFFDETVGPVAERAGRNAERRLLGLADTAASRRSTFPGEEGQDRARASRLLPVIEVIRAGIILIDGFLVEPQAEVPGIQVRNLQWITCDGGNMVDA